MKYDLFQHTFHEQKLITIDDILVRFPDIDRKQLTRWVSQGRLIHPARWLYILPHIRRDEVWMWECANMLVRPSYISLEYALGIYAFIPEEVVTLTCITTQKTQRYNLGQWWRYSYRSIIPRAFTEYRIYSTPRGKYLLATPAKALIDFCYFHPDYIIPLDFEEMRLKSAEVLEKTTPDELRQIAKIFKNKRLEIQIEALISYLLS